MIESGLVLAIPQIEKTHGVILAQANVLNPEFNRDGRSAILFAVREGRKHPGPLADPFTYVSLEVLDSTRNLTSVDGEEFALSERVSITRVLAPNMRSAMREGAKKIAEEIGLK